MQQDQFIFAYNQQNAAFYDNTMTLRMNGADGIRMTTNDGKRLYGQYQVSALTSEASGVVSAFYVSAGVDSKKAVWCVRSLSYSAKR